MEGHIPILVKLGLLWHNNIVVQPSKTAPISHVAPWKKQIVNACPKLYALLSIVIQMGMYFTKFCKFLQN